ncbi:MAG: hypothetical protein E7107_04790 [Prevotella sp.]|jgi:hypothetical protein|nr:hypothetical protein [Prevotella sp.]
MSEPTYHTLEEIQLRKEKLQSDIQQENDQIGILWRTLFAPQKASSKGELAANLLANSITAIDGFLLVRKLIKTYGFLFNRKKKKK